jgi:hypothetical protein
MNHTIYLSIYRTDFNHLLTDYLAIKLSWQTNSTNPHVNIRCELGIPGKSAKGDRG